MEQEDDSDFSVIWVDASPGTAADPEKAISGVVRQLAIATLDEENELKPVAASPIGFGAQVGQR